jgi:hypothetical protein
MPRGEISAWHWRQAMMIGSQLPEKRRDADVILECVKRLLSAGDRRMPAELQPEDGQVLRLVSPSNPRRRAADKDSPPGLSK